MSKNSRFNEDFSYIMLIISLLTVFSVLFVKLTYLVALTNDASSDSIIWVISFIFLCFTIGSVIGFYKNFKFTKNIQDYHKNMY